MYYSDILYIRNLHKVNCNTLYILNDEIYPLLIKENKHLDIEDNIETINSYKKIKLLRTVNFYFLRVVLASIVPILLVLLWLVMGYPI